MKFISQDENVFTIKCFNSYDFLLKTYCKLQNFLNNFFIRICSFCIFRDSSLPACKVIYLITSLLLCKMNDAYTLLTIGFKKMYIKIRVLLFIRTWIRTQFNWNLRICDKLLNFIAFLNNPFILIIFMSS